MGVVKQPLTPVGGRERRLRTERDTADRFVLAGQHVFSLEDVDRVAKRVGHVKFGTIQTEGHGRRANAGVDPMEFDLFQRSTRHLADSRQREIRRAVLGNRQRSRIAGAVADVADLIQPAIGQDVRELSRQRVPIERADDIRDDRPPMNVLGRAVGQAVEALMNHEQPATVRTPGKAADVVAGDDFFRLNFGPRDIDDSQPAAEGIRHDELHAVGAQNLTQGRERKRNRLVEFQMQRTVRAACEIDKRQLPRPLRGDKAFFCVSGDGNRHRIGRQRQRFDDLERAVAESQQMELMRRPIRRQEPIGSRTTHCHEIGKRFSDRDFGDKSSGLGIDHRNRARAPVCDKQKLAAVGKRDRDRSAQFRDGARHTGRCGLTFSRPGKRRNQQTDRDRNDAGSP